MWGNQATAVSDPAAGVAQSCSVVVEAIMVFFPFQDCNYLPPLSATFVEAVNGLFLQGDGDCDERVVSARCHGLEVA